MKRLNYRRGCLPGQNFERHTGMDGRGEVGDLDEKTEQTFRCIYHTIQQGACQEKGEKYLPDSNSILIKLTSTILMVVRVGCSTVSQERFLIIWAQGQGGGGGVR